jgi:hypothetical protein
MQTMASPRAHEYKVLSGEPYPGQPGSINGMPGKVWVYASEPGSTKPWGGRGAVQITCLAEVGGGSYSTAGVVPGPKVVRTLKVQVQPVSVFSAFALFGLDSSNNNEQPSIGVTGNSVVRIDGNVGTNGRTQNGEGSIGFTRGYNYNSEANKSGGSTQFQGSTVYEYQEPMIMPTVTEVLKYIVPPGTSDPWSWIRSNNDNDQIRQYASSSAALTRSGTTSAGFRKSQNILSNRPIGTWGSDLLCKDTALIGLGGSWGGVNKKPGSSTVRTLILPPGDYYLSGLDLDWDATTELLIDNGGFTTSAGNNVEAIPTRIWINGSYGKHTVRLPILLSDQSKPGLCQIYYGKDGGVFELIRDSQFPKKSFLVSGCIYAVTNRLDPVTRQPVDGTLKGTQINFYGDTNSSTDDSVLYGSLIADRVAFNGYCTIVYPSPPMGLPTDPSIGVGYTSRCSQEPCYSD